MNQVRIAAIGLGARGQYMLETLLLHMDNVRITAVCDLLEERITRTVEETERVYGEGNRPFASKITERCWIVTTWTPSSS